MARKPLTEEQKERKRANYAANPEKYREHYRKYRAANRETIRERDRQYRAANPEKYRESSRESNRKYRATNLEKERERNREHYRKYRAANPDKIRTHNRKLKYGVTAEYMTMLRNLQSGLCGCCGVQMTNGKRITRECVDHCHSTKRIRGLLCGSCNTGIGHLGDNVEGVLRALNYLWNSQYIPQP